jgi:hypothetical protein
MKSKQLWLYSTVIAVAGCASKAPTQPVVHERGWIGGCYAMAVPAGRFFSPGGKDVVRGLPKAVREKQAGAILITEAPEKSPVARGGLRAGDLILELNGKPMLSLKEFRKTVDAGSSGTLLRFSIYRDDKIIEETVTSGSEKYREEHMFVIGIGLGTTIKIDPIPDPDFSLVALGYRHKEDRLNLTDSKVIYQRTFSASSMNSTNAMANGYRSSEGWNSWLGIFSLGEHKMILSQE